MNLEALLIFFFFVLTTPTPILRILRCDELVTNPTRILRIMKCDKVFGSNFRPRSLLCTLRFLFSSPHTSLDSINEIKDWCCRGSNPQPPEIIQVHNPTGPRCPAVFQFASLQKRIKTNLTHGNQRMVSSYKDKNLKLFIFLT